MQEPVSQSEQTVNEPHLGQLNLGAQGDFRRVLFVCSGGMLRSATSAHWAAAVLNWNTRSCGTMDAALPPVHENLLAWAQDVLCMEQHHKEAILAKFPWAQKKIQVLGVPDVFFYRHPGLIAMLEKIFAEHLPKPETTKPRTSGEESGP